MGSGAGRAVVLSPGGPCLETFWLPEVGREQLLASGGWWPGMLLPVLQCAGQVLPQRVIQSKGSVVLRALLRH